MNIVYGGSFNPPTNAHYEIVEKLLSTFKNANVIVLPVGDSYYKPELVNFNHRLAMLELIFSNVKGVIVSNLEGIKRFDGTLKSLNELSKNYNNLALVIGSDNLVDFDKWINYEEILTNYQLIIMQRNNDDIDLLMKKFNYLNPNYQKVSFDHQANSTLIRSNIKQNQSWLNKKVYQYIIDNKLYEV